MEFKIPSTESLSDKFGELSVLYLILNDFHEDVVVEAVEPFGDVTFEVIRRRTKLSLHLSKGSVTAPIRAETVVILGECGFKDCL